MRKIISISFIFIVMAFPLAGQQQVVDVNSLQGKYPVRIMPDVEGKILIGDTNFRQLSGKNSQGSLEVLPGFPVSVTGANERGGTYGNLDEDPDLELIYSAGNTIHAFNFDGTTVDGWPVTLDHPNDGAPAFGDVDGDGQGEIVVTTHQQGSFAFGSVYALEADGSDVEGFPVATEGGGVRTPVLADLDNDGAMEIIITIRDFPDGFVCVYKGDGTIYPGWPVRMDYIPGSDVAVGDIDGDEIPEIVTESYYGLHAFTADGFLIEGFPYYPGLERVFSYSTPVLADLDGNGTKEIICGDHSTFNGTGAIHVVDHLGNPLDGWPKITGSWIYGPPSIGDINGDGLLDIVVGDQALSASPINKIYAWTGITADTLDGFPINDVFGVNSQVIIADLDGDNQVELLFDDNTSTGNFHGYNHDGTIMEGWPLPVNGSTFFINPMVVDLNLDGTMEISGAGFEVSGSILNIYLWDAAVEMDNSLALLPTLQYNTRHSGVFGDTLMVGIKEQGSWEAGEPGGVVVYPHPASDYITIQCSSSENDLQFSIYDFSGNEILKGNIESLPLNINVNHLPSGIYFITICRENKIEGSGKFIISK